MKKTKSKKEKIKGLEFKMSKLKEIRDDKLEKLYILALEINSIEERLITIKNKLIKAKR